MASSSNNGRRTSKSHALFEALREEILENILQPGDAVSLEGLCKRFGVSRSPASNALSKLADLGLVDIFPQHGTFVSAISLSAVQENAFLRECIETGVVRRLAGNLTENQKAKLLTNLRIQRALAESGDDDGFYKYDKEFHQLLVGFSGLHKPNEILQNAGFQLERARQMIVPVATRVQSALHEHEDIAQALFDADPDAAAQAMRTHLVTAMATLETIVGENPEKFSTKKT